MFEELKDTWRELGGFAAGLLLVLSGFAVVELEFIPALELLTLGGICALTSSRLTRSSGSSGQKTPIEVGHWKFMSLATASMTGLLGAYCLASQQFDVGLRCLGVALVLLWAWAALERYERGWIIDDNGERQKVAGRDRHGVIVFPTTHLKRRSDEFLELQERRGAIIFCGVASFLSVAATYGLWNVRLGLALMIGTVCIFTIPCFLYYLGRELLYQTGYQYMRGAKVRDPQPRPLGLDLVNEQKAHGGARITTLDETLELLKREG